MPAPNESYAHIQTKIHAMKSTYTSLRDKPDDYVFSALCAKSIFFKNPALNLHEHDFEDMIVDGRYDGGVDVLLTDPSSDASDLVLIQSKYYTSISSADVLNAMIKLASFYQNMIEGHYEEVNAKVQRRFLSLFSELGDESRIHFVFCTSAPQSGINRVQIEKKFRAQFTNSSQFDVSFFFGKDITEEIKESESRRPTVEYGKIKMDRSNNYLLYGSDDTAAIVNVSAFSIKTLYAQYNIQLLSKNLRYHVRGPSIDKGIKETIQHTPELFWMKNNGITIICCDFEIDGKEVKLYDFSIINGAQTTYMLQKSKYIDEKHDLFLPCKIIKIMGDTQDEQNAFSLAIAQATNSQKPIRSVDLKANSPEQVRFAQAMREQSLFYETKRGEPVPAAYREPFLNTSLVEVGKLALTAVYQLPCTSRNKPSSLYLPQYYEKIFNGNQQQIAKLCRELLYIDHYFRKIFVKKFDDDYTNSPNADRIIPLAHNARTICIAFVSLASRYIQKNILDTHMDTLFSVCRTNFSSEKIYDIFCNLEGISYFFPPNVFAQKNQYDNLLDQLFHVIIDAAFTTFSVTLRHDNTLTANNFFKNDKNYYAILEDNWRNIKPKIEEIFNNVL